MVLSAEEGAKKLHALLYPGVPFPEKKEESAGVQERPRKPNSQQPLPYRHKIIGLSPAEQERQLRLSQAVEITAGCGKGDSLREMHAWDAGSNPVPAAKKVVAKPIKREDQLANLRKLDPEPLIEKVPESNQEVLVVTKPRRRAHNRKAPAKVVCPRGVTFEVHPPWMAKNKKYHSDECRKKYNSKKLYIITPEMDAKIIETYRGNVGIGKADKGEGPVNLLAKELGLPRWKVSRRAFQLGVVSKQVYSEDRVWSTEEIDLLKSISHLGVDRIGVRMAAAGFKRSRNALVLKIKRLYGHKPREGYSATALSNLFGIDGHSVTRWIESGLLLGTRRGTSRTESQGGDSYLIQEANVREFVVKNVSIIDFRKVDKFWLVELLAGEREKTCKSK